jgi:uncharacterized membrane protein
MPRSIRKALRIKLLVDVRWQTIPLRPIRCGWLALRLFGTATAAVDKLEWGNFRLLRIFLFAPASVAHEAKVVLFGLFGCEAVAGAMLPHVARVAGYTVAAVVEIVAVHTTYRAVKVPLTVFFFKLLKFLFVLLLLREALTLRDALSICGGITLGTMGNSTVGVIFQPGQLLFVENALGFTFPHSLLSGKSARFVTLFMVSYHT